MYYAGTKRGSSSRARASSLHGLEREFASKLELEHTVLEQRATELKREARKQARQRAFLREERKKAREDRESLEADKAAMKHRDKEDWFPGDYLDSGKGRLRLNVGGQVFEISKTFLAEDGESLLAALAAEDCPLYNNQEEASQRGRIAYVDRDWWLFRYILIFLRDGVLPQSQALSLQLYKEATFWRLRTLQRAIEETHLDLYRTKIDVDRDPTSKTFGLLAESTEARDSKFWLSRPNWWESQAHKAKDDEGPPPDWWTDGDVHGAKRYGPLSTHPKKVVASKKEAKEKVDVYPMISSTWGYYR